MPDLKSVKATFGGLFQPERQRRVGRCLDVLWRARAPAYAAAAPCWWVVPRCALPSWMLFAIANFTCCAHSLLYAPLTGRDVSLMRLLSLAVLRLRFACWYSFVTGGDE